MAITARREQRTSLSTAYCLNEHTIRLIVDLFISQDLCVSYKVTLSDGSELRMTELDELLTLPNYGAEKIVSMTMFGHEKYSIPVGIAFHNDGDISFTCEGDRDFTSLMEFRIKALIRNARVKYSWVISFPAWCVVLFSIAMGALNMAIILSINHDDGHFLFWPGNRVDRWKLLAFILVNSASFVVSGFTNSWLFPKAQFIIGAGKARADAIASRRSILFWGVLVAFAVSWSAGQM